MTEDQVLELLQRVVSETRQRAQLYYFRPTADDFFQELARGITDRLEERRNPLPDEQDRRVR